MQVHATAGNDRLDEHGVPGRRRDIDREKPRRSDPISVRPNVVPGRVFAPPAECEHSRVTEIGLPRSSQSTTAMPIDADLAVPSAVITSVPAWAVDTGVRPAESRVAAPSRRAW